MLSAHNLACVIRWLVTVFDQQDCCPETIEAVANILEAMDYLFAKHTGEDCSELWTQSGLGWCWNEGIYVEGPPAFRYPATSIFVFKRACDTRRQVCNCAEEPALTAGHLDTKCEYIELRLEDECRGYNHISKACSLADDPLYRGK